MLIGAIKSGTLRRAALSPSITCHNSCNSDMRAGYWMYQSQDIAGSMRLLDKPEWWDAPVLTKANIRRYRRTLLFIVLASVLVGFFTSAIFSNDNVTPIEWFLRTSSITFALILFIAAVIFAVFFFYRTFANNIRAALDRQHPPGTSLFVRLFKPTSLWDRTGLSEQGLNHRRLAIEGLAGFLGSMVLASLMVLIMRLSGFDVGFG